MRLSSVKRDEIDGPRCQGIMLTKNQSLLRSDRKKTKEDLLC